MNRSGYRHSRIHTGGFRWGRATLHLLGAAFVVMAAAGEAQAQERPVSIPEPGETLYQVELRDGSSVVVRVTAVNEQAVVLTTVGGATVTVERAQILRISAIEGTVSDGRFWPRDPSDTRLFFTATGRTLRQGEGYVGTYLVVLPFAAIGLTDRLTIAGGAPVLFGQFEPWYIAPKLQLIREENTQLAVGTLLFVFEGNTAGIAYGVATFGSSDAALTAGVGFGYTGLDFANKPVGMVGGELRASRRLKLLSENYLLPTGAIFSGGIRFLGERFTGDLGMAAFGSGDGGGCCLPLINLSYALGGSH
jgi:hypothetical protein